MVLDAVVQMMRCAIMCTWRATRQYRVGRYVMAARPLPTPRLGDPALDWKMQSRLDACQILRYLRLNCKRVTEGLLPHYRLQSLRAAVMIPVTIVTGFLGSGKTSKFLRSSTNVGTRSVFDVKAD